MATNKDDVSNLLKCTICLETFKVPKCIPCLHTFCESCISGIVSYAVEKGKIADLNCPVCRQSLGLQDFKGDVETWTTSLPVNHLMVSLIDRQAIRKSEKLCDPCQLNKETVKAASWCTICEEGLCAPCEKNHRSFKAISKHLIFPIDQFAKNTESDIGISGMNECIAHPGKPIEVYCVDHENPCCTLCATLLHRKCESVLSIAAAATGIKQSKKSTELAEKLDTRSKIIGENIKNRKEGIWVVENETNTVLTNVDEIKDAVVKHVIEIADKFKETVTSAKKNAIITMSDEATELSSVKCTVDNWKVIFDTCLQQASEQQCLVEIERITKKFDDLESDTKFVMSKLTKPKISYKPNKKISEFPTNVESFGDYSLEMLTKKAIEEKPRVNFQNGNIKVLHTIDIDVNTTTGHSCISGTFVKGSIILTNRYNKEVLKYDTNYTYISSLTLPTGVADVTHIEKDTMAVASVFEDKIYIIDTKSMTLTSTIIAPTKVYGLQYANGQEHFIAANSGTLTWISKSGEKIKEQNTSGNAYFVCPSGKNSYIYADGDNTVSMIKDGNKVFNYTAPTLKTPIGIDVDFEGNIYIVGCISGNIHQLTNTGEHIRTISTKDLGIEVPRILRFKPNSAIFLLTSNNIGRVVICEIN